MDEYAEAREYFSNIKDDEIWEGRFVRELALKLLELAEFERGHTANKQELHERLMKSLKKSIAGGEIDGQ